MKNKYISIIVSTFVLIIIFSPKGISTNQVMISKVSGVSYIQNDFNSSQFIETIIEKLYNGAIYQNDKLLGWRFRESGPFENDERTYVGFNVGMAGIGDFLLNAYLNGYQSSENLLTEIVLQFEKSALSSNGGGMYWDRYTNEDSAGWIGLRYGTIGIIQFLSELEKNGYPGNYQYLIPEGYTYLKSMQLADGAWPMTEGGYITTGQEYGATGVGIGMLRLFQNTNNITYLDEAIDVGNYLINNGVWEKDAFKLSWTPQQLGSEFDGLQIYGKKAGIAGIIDFLLDLYDESSKIEFYDTAIGLGNTILANDQGGYWNDGSVSYVSKIFDRNDGLTGYGVGSIGIAETLIKLYEISKNEKYLISSVRAEKFVQSLLNDDLSLPVGLLYQDNLVTGISLGVAGLSLFLQETYSKYGIDRHLNQAIDILIHIEDLIEENGLMPYDESNLSFGFSYNIQDGIAGLGNILLLLESISKGSKGNNYEQLYLKAIPNLEYRKVIDSSSTISETKIFDIASIILIIWAIIPITTMRRKQIAN